MSGRLERKKRTGILVGIVIVLCLLIGILFVATREGADAHTETFSLRLEGVELVVISDGEGIAELSTLLSAAEDIGYVPKTFILGPELVYTGTDDQEVRLELDMDSDLFRYDGRFFDYGPGNDNNAMPRLLNLLGLKDWPEEVKAAYPEWFASGEGDAVPVVTGDRSQTVYMDLWYPDWYYVKIREAHALAILEALREANPAAVDSAMVSVEESEFTLHIAYDDGREYDLACIGGGVFLMWECGTENVYSISSEDFRSTVEEMIALSKETAE